MANNSTDIRRLMSLMESAQEPMLIEGWLTNLKNKKIKKMGQRERAEMADRLKNEWLKWLGQTNRSGTADDMDRFMRIRIGFKDQDVHQVLSSVLPDEEPQAGEPEASAAPKAQEPNAEDGVPIPKDLNRKLSDFGKVGINVEQNDNKTDPGEIVDNPRKYQMANGDWDRKKITDKLSKMPIGDKLTLGTSTFSRSVGKPENASRDMATSESIMEAEADTEVLDNDIVDDIMDASAARINDEYLLNGPVNDTNDAIADVAASGMAGRQGGTRQGRETSPNTGGPKASGQYDADEMWAILKNDFQKTKPWIESLTRKVKSASSISNMTDSDMQDLGLIAYAFLRART